MNRHDFIRELGWTKTTDAKSSDLLDRIERIVRLAEAAEREACAVIVFPCCKDCAKEIRARSKA